MAIDLSITVEELAKKQFKLFVATPMYGGNCTGNYTKSIADLVATCTKVGIQVQLYFLMNESLIQRARNYCCDEFLRSNCTHMIFIDADITFNPNDVIALLLLADRDPENYNILTGPYPKKCISWEKIKLAVDKGAADENPNILENYVGDYVFNPVGSGSIRLDEPAEILEGGTGFMLFSRATLERYAEAYPQYRYKPDHVRTEHFDGKREITAFFDCSIDPETKRYLSEDYHFSQYARKIGLKIWLCGWMRLAHTGTYTFGGSLVDLAQINASPTA